MRKAGPAPLLAVTALRCSPFFRQWAEGLRQRGESKAVGFLLRLGDHPGQYLPKGESMAGLSQHQCKAIARKLNTRPRKRLGFRTPLECFNES